MEISDGAATGGSAQDIAEVIEQKLYGSSEEPESTDDVVSDDAEVELPEDDDTESDDEGSEEVAEDIEDGDVSLAAQFGVDEDRLSTDDQGNVVFEAIVDGEKKNVLLKDLAVSYQLQGHVNNKSMALEEERKAFEQEKQNVGIELMKRAEGLGGLSKVLEDQLVGEYNSIDWEALRSADPAEYTALRQDFSDRANQLQQQKHLIGQEQARNIEEAKLKSQEALQNKLKFEFEKMVEKNPEWADSEKYKSDMKDIKSFVTEEYGFSDDDLNAVSDHRLMGLIKDAFAYRKGKLSAEAKKTKAIPKFQKPGINRTSAKNLEKARSVKSKRANLKKTGSVQDTANLLLDRM